MSTEDTAAIIRSYHDAWTTKDFARATALLGPAGAVEVQVPAPNGRPLDVEAELAAGLGFEQGVLTHPGDHGLRPNEVLVHLLRRGLDVDGGGDGFSGHRRTPRRA